jgi:hypothetical protein
MIRKLSLKLYHDNSAVILDIPHWSLSVRSDYWIFNSDSWLSAVILDIPPWFLSFRSGSSYFAVILDIPQWWFLTFPQWSCHSAVVLDISQWFMTFRSDYWHSEVPVVILNCSCTNMYQYTVSNFFQVVCNKQKIGLWFKITASQWINSQTFILEIKKICEKLDEVDYTNNGTRILILRRSIIFQ